MQWIHALLLFAQTTYYGPHVVGPSVPGQHVVRVEVLVYDDPAQGGLRPQEVIFNGHSIALKPRDIHSYRGGGSFQVAPGTYPLEWVVLRDKITWPRTLTYKESIVIDKSSMWVQVTIRGGQLETD